VILFVVLSLSTVDCNFVTGTAGNAHDRVIVPQISVDSLSLANALPP
jgi:hypothetical protein